MRRVNETTVLMTKQQVLHISLRLGSRAWVRACACVRVCVWVQDRGDILARV